MLQYYFLEHKMENKQIFWGKFKARERGMGSFYE